MKASDAFVTVLSQSYTIYSMSCDQNRVSPLSAPRRRKKRKPGNKFDLELVALFDMRSNFIFFNSTVSRPENIKT